MVYLGALVAADILRVAQVSSGAQAAVPPGRYVHDEVEGSARS